MKKQPYILIGITSFLFVAFLFRSIFKVLDLEWSSLFQDLEKTEKIVFLALMFSFALAFCLSYSGQWLMKFQEEESKPISNVC